MFGRKRIEYFLLDRILGAVIFPPGPDIRGRYSFSRAGYYGQINLLPDRILGADIFPPGPEIKGKYISSLVVY